MAKDLKGATVVSEELKDEAGSKLRQVKKGNSFAHFLAVMKKNEEVKIVAQSGDMEVIEDISTKDLKEVQDAKRLVGYDPETKTALVLKLAFLEKKAKKSK